MPSPPPPPRQPLPLSRRLGFALVTTSLVLGLLEGGARLLPGSLTGRREIVLSEPGKGQAMVASEDVPGWDIQAPGGNIGNQPYTANQWRMRGPEYPATKEPWNERVILVGDSSIFGFMLEWPNTIAARLEQRREQRFPGVDYQVAACAVPGHTTVQSIYKLERHCLAFQPDVVIIGNRNSDGTMAEQSDRERFGLMAWGGPGRALQGLALYRLFRNGWLRARVASQPPTQAQRIAHAGDPSAPTGNKRRVPPEEYEQNLVEMVRISRDAGATPVLFLLPILYDLPAYKDNSPANAQYNQAMRRVAERQKVALADGQQWFSTVPPLPGLFMDSVHPDQAGAQLLADLLDQTLPAPRARAR